VCTILSQAIASLASEVGNRSRPTGNHREPDFKEKAMQHEGGFRFLAALAALGLVGILALGAFGAGFAAGSASDAGATVWVHGGHWPGQILGFLVTIILVVILFRLIAMALFGHRHYHRAWAHQRHWRDWDDADRFGPPSGPGGWHRSEWREVGQAYFDDFHRRAHGAEPPAGDSAPTGNASTDGPGSEQPQ
jgi:hypothetical protein